MPLNCNQHCLIVMHWSIEFKYNLVLIPNN